MFFFDFRHIFAIFIRPSGKKGLNLHSTNGSATDKGGHTHTNQTAAT